MAKIDKTHSSIAGEDAGKGTPMRCWMHGESFRNLEILLSHSCTHTQKDYILLQRYLLTHADYWSNHSILSVDTPIHAFSCDFDKPLRISSLKQVSLLPYPTHTKIAQTGLRRLSVCKWSSQTEEGMRGRQPPSIAVHTNHQRETQIVLVSDIGDLSLPSAFADTVEVRTFDASAADIAKVDEHNLNIGFKF